MFMSRLMNNSNNYIDLFIFKNEGYSRNNTIKKIFNTYYGYDVQDNNILVSKLGKPFLDSNKYYFNISHSGEYVIFAVSDDEIGIDIQKMDEIKKYLQKQSILLGKQCAQEFIFSPYEDKFIKKCNSFKRFYIIWTIKEAYIKYSGQGLNKTLNSFIVLHYNNSYYIYDSCLRSDIVISSFDWEKEYKISICSKYKNFNLFKIE